MSKKKPTKKDFQKDFKMVSQKFIEDFPNTPVAKMTRDFYRKHSEYGTAFQTLFGKFDNLKKEMLTEEDMERGRDFDLEKKIVTLEAENSKLKKNNKELLKGAVEEDGLLEIYRENLGKEIKFPINNKKLKLKSDKDFVLNISDVHLGEIVRSNAVNGVNEYNKEICVKRLDNLFDKVVQYSKKMTVDVLYIMLNGDLVSGGIHQELVRNSDLNEVESIFYLQEYLIKKFSEISEFFNRIEVEVVVGNHSRILPGRPYAKEQVSMNFEYILGRQLKMYFDTLIELKKNNKIFINVPESSFIVKRIKNLKFLVTHGSILSGAGSGGFAGIPFYSICMSASKLYGVLHQIGLGQEVQFDNILAGHLHTSCKIPLFNGGHCWVNGCVIGSNEFGLTKMKSVAKKEQLLLIIDDDGIDGEINIRLD